MVWLFYTRGLGQGYWRVLGWSGRAWSRWGEGEVVVSWSQHGFWSLITGRVYEKCLMWRALCLVKKYDLREMREATGGIERRTGWYVIDSYEKSNSDKRRRDTVFWYDWKGRTRQLLKWKIILAGAKLCSWMGRSDPSNYDKEKNNDKKQEQEQW